MWPHHLTDDGGRQTEEKSVSNQTGSKTEQEVVKQEVVITLRGSMNSTESSGQTGSNQAGSNTGNQN